MSCLECGIFFSIGSDVHKSCREKAAKRAERELRIDTLLDIFEEDINLRLLRNV